MLLLRTSRGVDPGIPLLRSLGSNAHVWIPGANGVNVASLPSNNYLLSAGSTGYSTVDGVDGLTLDGMGSLGSELVAGNNLSTATVTGSCVKNSSTQFTLSANAIANRISIALPLIVAPAAVFHTVRLKADKACTILAGNLWSASKALALTMSYQTFEFVLADDTAPHSQNLSFYTTADSPVVVDVEYVSSKAYSGTHLTQATTANKPLVRRGMLNLLTSSSDLSGAGWAASNAARLVDQDGTADLVYPNTTGVFRGVYKVYATGVIPCTVAFLVKPAGFTNIAIVDLSGSAHAAWFNLTTGVDSNVLGGYTASIAPQANGYYLCVISGTGSATSVAQFSVVDSAGSNTATANGTNGVYVANVGLFKGTWTAAQILAEGGIPTTTATAASNPTSGKYWWSFDGSNDSLLSGNLGITNACTIVIAGRVNSLSAIQMLLGEDLNGVGLYLSASGAILFSKYGAGTIVSSSAATVVAGIPFVITARLASGTAVIRVNGVQVATAATALTYAATTGARIGTGFGGASDPLNGALGWVVPLPVALSDAECLTVERLVGSQFPGMATF